MTRHDLQHTRSKGLGSTNLALHQKCKGDMINLLIRGFSWTWVVSSWSIIANEEDEVGRKVHRLGTSNINKNRKLELDSSENGGEDLRLDNGGDMEGKWWIRLLGSLTPKSMTDWWDLGLTCQKLPSTKGCWNLLNLVSRGGKIKHDPRTQHDTTWN